MLRKLIRYQKQRFPIFILLLSLIPAALSSYAVSNNNFNLSLAMGALLISILYLLHIRLIDERRDFLHDSRYHKDRPIQRGIISNKELKIIDFVAILLVILLTVLINIHAFPFLITLLIYSYFAEKEFFLKKLRQYFLIYNSLNIVQMFLLQILIYNVISAHIQLNQLISFHFIFTCLGTIIFEFLRKTNATGTDGLGKDTYSYHLGLENSITIYFVMLILIFFTFIALVFSTQVSLNAIFLIPIALFIISILSAFYFLAIRNSKAQLLTQLSFICMYSVFNYYIFILLTL